MRCIYRFIWLYGFGIESRYERYNEKGEWEVFGCIMF